MTRVAGEISDCTITGPLDVNLNKKDSWLDFSHVTFEDHADFSGTRALGIRFDRCRFLKGVNLSGVRLTSSLIAYKTAFLTDAKAPGPALRFDGAQIGEELTVLACSVEGGVFGENLRVTGNADFRGLRVYAKGAAPRGALLQNLADRNEFREAFGGGYPRLPCAFRLMGSQVGGSLLMAALYDESIKDLPDPPVPHRFPRIAFLGGNAMLANVKISGDLDLRGLVATGRLSLQNSTIGGSVEAHSRSHPSGRSVRFVAGDSVDMYGVQVGGNIVLQAAHLARGANVCFGRIAGYLFAKPFEGENGPPLEMGRSDHDHVSLDLSGSHIDGVECEGAKIDGYIRAATGEFGRFYLTPSSSSPDPDASTISPCSVAAVLMRSVTIKEDARFHGIQVNGDISDLPLTERGYPGSLRMTGCSVGGMLAIGSDGLSKHIWPGLPEEKRPATPTRLAATFERAQRDGAGGVRREQRAPEAPTDGARAAWWDVDARNKTVLQGVDLSGTTIGRDLNLSSTVVGTLDPADGEDGQATPALPSGDGNVFPNRIVLDHATVGGNLRMSRMTFSYGQPRLVVKFRTRCTNVSAVGVHCKGNVDLTGLEVHGDIVAPRITVGGTLSLASERARQPGGVDDPRDQQPRRSRHRRPPATDVIEEKMDADTPVEQVPRCAEIFGDVDLNGASASTLVLSGTNFHADDSHKGCLDLSHTSFHQISINDAAEIPKRDGMMKFHNATIARWDLTDDDWETRFHNKTLPHEGGAFVSIEKYLREEGRFHLANRVLNDRVGLSTADRISKARKRRGRVSALPAVAGIRFMWAIGKFIGFGTNPWPSLAAIVTILIGLIAMFADPNHVIAGKTLRDRTVAAATLQWGTAADAQRASVPQDLHPADPRWANYCPADQTCVKIGSQWRWWNAVSIAGRYVVPFASFVGEDLWQPSLSFWMPVRVLAVVAWICWPLFVGTLSRYVLRKL